MKEVINTFQPRVEEIYWKYSSMQLEVKNNESMAPCGKIGVTRHLFQFFFKNHDFPCILLVSMILLMSVGKVGTGCELPIYFCVYLFMSLA